MSEVEIKRLTYSLRARYEPILMRNIENWFQDLRIATSASYITYHF